MTASELHALRKRLGHTQKRMAEIFGVSVSQYGNWERGVDGRTGKKCPIPRAIELACMARQPCYCGGRRPARPLVMASISTDDRIVRRRMMKRTPGFYWVRRLDTWEPAEWVNGPFFGPHDRRVGYWRLLGEEMPFDTKDLAEVGQLIQSEL